MIVKDLYKITNAVDGPAEILQNGIVEILNKLKKEEKKFIVKEQENRPDFSSIIGFYANDWSTSLYSQIDSKLVSIFPDLDNPAEILFIFKHNQGFKFTIPKDFPFNSPRQQFEFMDDSEGEKFILDSHQGKEFRFKFTY